MGVMLAFALFFPRLSLFIGWLLGGCIPLNPFPLFADILMTLFIPRTLICMYIAMNYADIPHAGWWLTAHVIGLCISIGSKSSDN